MLSHDHRLSLRLSALNALLDRARTTTPCLCRLLCHRLFVSTRLDPGGCRYGTAVEPVTDLSHVRLICMGFGILPDTKSLAGVR